MCERKAENYSAGTSLVIISYPRSSLPKMVEPAGTQEAELGPEGFGALMKGDGFRGVKRIPRCSVLLLEMDFMMKILHVALSNAMYDLSLSTCRGQSR